MEQTESRFLIDQVRAGDSSAENEVFDRYLVRLLALVRSRLSSKLARRVDPEDIVQSAYRSFFRRVASDEIVLNRAGDLWRLLASFSMNKLRSQIEFHTQLNVGRSTATLLQRSKATSFSWRMLIRSQPRKSP